MLKKVKPTRVSDLVFEQLRDLIFKGRFKPGEQLMNENQLAESLGVSRPTLREAINRLVALGLVQHRRGHGTFVNRAAFNADKNPFAAMTADREISLIDLLEERLGLECNAAKMAAARATDEDIADLERSLEQAAIEVEHGGLGQQADEVFHMNIAYATKNAVHIHLMKNFFALLFYGINKNRQNPYNDPVNLEKAAEQHARILETIRARDPDSAYSAMEEHIKFVLDFIKRAENPSFSI
ncbi:MAG TPA: FadR/GntR family transcriptional regulator [Syntrophobacteraceae bacterium]|nr:FadR/GntR family transcriptional regulator [Syntrophobacteraceae bacterium]